MVSNNNNLRIFDGLVLDVGKKVLWNGDRPVDLPNKAACLLSHLVEHCGEIVVKEELLDAVWGDSFVEENILAQNIYLVRKALDSNGSSRSLIETIPKRGYRFVGKVDEPEEEVEVTIERRRIQTRVIGELIVGAAEGRALPSTVLPVSSGKRPLGVAGVMVIAGAVVAAVLGAVGLKQSFDRNTVATIPAGGPSAVTGPDRERLSTSERVFAVGLSQDGKHAAYTTQEADGTYAVELHHLPTDSRTRIVEHSTERIYSLELSPEGNYLYFARNTGGGGIGVFKMPVYGGQEQLVTKGLAQGFSLSPDGKRIAFYTVAGERTYRLEMCDSRDCGERVIVAERGGDKAFAIWTSSPSWSTDGRRLLTTAEEFGKPGERPRVRLMEIDVESRRETFLETPAWYRTGQAYWSEDGNAVYVAAREKKGDPVQLFRVPTDGVTANVTLDDRSYRDFRVHRDGSFSVGVTWDRSTNLFLVGVDGTKPRQLTFDNGISNGGYGIHWTPDGKKIVFVRSRNDQDSDLYVYDVASGKQARITYDGDSFINRVDLTTDGERILFGSNRSGTWHIWEVGVDGKELRRITEGSGGSSPALSSDGGYLYFNRGGMRRISIPGGREEMIADGATGVTWPSPSDPERVIATVYDAEEKRQKFVIYNAGDYANHRELEIDAFDNLQWNEEGSGFYFLDMSESFNNVWFYDLRDGSKNKITDFQDLRITNLSLSPDGKTFALARAKVIGNLFKISRNKSH